jgi:phosphatidylglycerophosphatase A
MTMRSRVAWVLATWFGCGRVPVAPGTAGAVGAIPLYLAALQLGRPGVAAAAVASIGVGVWASSIVARDLRTKDPQVIVIDEVAGMLVTMVPVAHGSWKSLAIGFLLFRVLDMTKPPPIRWLERLPGGWGIVLDDVAAGVVGAAVLAALGATGVLR